MITPQKAKKKTTENRKNNVLENKQGIIVVIKWYKR